MARLGTHTWCALFLACLVCVCNAQKDPPCPLDMEKTLPAARYWGNLPCQFGSTATEAGGGRCEDIKGKIALIIGASTGLGRGVADRLAQAGMTVIGTSRNPQQYTNGNSCTYTKPGDRCKPVGWQLWQLEITSQASVDALMQRMKSTYGRIDFLFINAGRGYGSNSFNPNGKSYCNDISRMQEVMDTNFWGPVRVLIAALPLVQRTGYARILITASVATWVSIQGGLPYGASKAAVADIGEEWLYEHFDGRAKNIKFTTLHPGSMLSDLARKSVPACDRMASNFENEWKQWEAGQYGRPDSVYLTPAQGGEALYRLAIDPNPKKRYILNEQRSLGFMRKRLCTHFTAPMDVWPKAWN
ncbi:hypothetical protein OEZ86_012608 [Tetradesmus obliquus]|uniref:Uncharacterized protein n=1 Tax=Tetradesmus obliquus TaxID=3088 RepID=A0ABY8TY66_TETOB|nr:hypothetical protein OEZ85_002645 [Tetradesmus obliquus]WIA34262.1 hypothetical protein OEZ86_012608 [Tetradesmus obliquus]